MQIPNGKASTVADGFVKRFVCVHEASKSVLIDRRTNFTSTLMRHVAKIFKINQCKTTSFYPQSNGSLEGSHMVLKEYLKQYANKDCEWDKWIELATNSYNTSVHEGTS